MIKTTKGESVVLSGVLISEVNYGELWLENIMKFQTKTAKNKGFCDVLARQRKLHFVIIFKKTIRNGYVLIYPGVLC